MKTQYEAERPRLTLEERRNVWDGIISRSSTRERGPRRLILAYASAAAILGIAAWLILPGRDAVRPQPSPVATTAEVTPPVSTPPEPAGAAGLDRPVAARAPAKPSRRAAGSGGPPAAPHNAAPMPIDTAAAPLLAEARPSPTPAQPAPDSVATAAPTGLGRTIRGSVRDDTGKPIAYANVIIVGTPWGAMTNDAGAFTIRAVPQGTYTLKAMCIGYGVEAADSVRVLPDLATNVDFQLKQAVAAVIDMVEITSARQLIKLKSTSTAHSINSKSMENLPVDEVAEMIGLKAGVVAQGGELHFRGGGAAASPSQQPPVIPITGGSTLPNDEPYDSMYFEHYGVNPFIATDEDSLSTFAADVDQASYTVTRRYIDLGHLPPKEAVRVEEFVNFFKQGYPEFHEPDFRILVDGAPSAFGKGYYLLRIGLKGRVIEPEHRKPANLVFVIDQSGSMAREDRLELVKRALEILIAKLRPDDRVGLVVYDTDAQSVMEPVSMREKDALLSAIRGLEPRNSTNAEAGLRLGYDMARRNYDPAKVNRIILCTDGVANEGVTGAEGILERVRRESDKGINLTAIGFGMGNYNDVLLEKLADTGDGAYYYVDRLEEAARVLEENLTGTLQTIAQDVKIQVAFDPRRVVRYRLLGFENRDVADRDFRNDRVDAGEIGAGHEMTALYEVKLVDGSASGRVATVRLRYAGPNGDAAGPPDVHEITQRFDTGGLTEIFEDAPPRLRLDAAAAEFAEILRGSFWAKESRIVDVLSVLRGVAGELSTDPDVQEFVAMVEKATGLSEQVTPAERDARGTQVPPRRPE